MTQMSPTLPGTLVISLDFELHWGVRDRHRNGSAYTPRLLGARTVVPRILELFEEFGVAATWATVGFLFAQSRAEIEAFSPALRPAYRDARLSSYAEPLGSDEHDDPLHFAPSLLALIRRTPRQEIATHTFSHYYCGEAGQSAQTFDADIGAACALAEAHGFRLRSIVFPRNQHNPDYDSILRQHGIVAYRGNPPSWIWRFGSAQESAGRMKRAGRLLDAYVPLSGAGSTPWSAVVQPSGLTNVPASFFVRPFTPALRSLEPLRLARLRRSMRAAARSGRIVHLWWHPHNFGIWQPQNLDFVRRLLTEFLACRDEFGMLSLTMGDVDRLARGATGSHDGTGMQPPAAQPMRPAAARS